MKRIAFIFRTDVHASDKSPASWKGDYPAEIWANLEQIGQLAREHSVDAVLDGGDYFHIKASTRNTHALVRRTADLHAGYPCPTYLVPGNHDVAYNNLDTLERQPLGVLFSTGVFQRLSPTQMLFKNPGPGGALHVRVIGAPYDPNRTLEQLRAIKKEPTDSVLIAVVHQLAGKSPPANIEEFYGEPVFRYEDLVYEGGPDVWCFPSGTPVLDRLYRPVAIEHVVEGQAVLGRGVPCFVEAVHPVRQVREEVIALDIEGVPPLVSGATAEHPYWVATGMKCVLPSRGNRRCHPDKVSSSHPCSSCADMPSVQVSWVQAGNIVAGDYVAIPVPRIPSGASSCPGLARLLGYYAAEGHIIENRGKEPVAGVAWSFHEDERDLHEDVRALVQEYFGLETHEHPTSGACTQVCAYGQEISEFFARHAGRFSDRKSLSSWLWQRPAVDRLEFLTGWLLGDGHARVAKIEVSGATASKALGFQVFFLALSLGLRPFFTIRPPQEHANHPCHVISFYGDDGELLSRRVGVTPSDRTKTKVAGFFDGGLYYARVRGTSKTLYEGPVHNFRTSTGEYVVGGVLVHNCFGHWHKDQGIEVIDGRHFVNLGAVSRGSLVKENLERNPKVALIEVTQEESGPKKIEVTPIRLKVAPAEDQFDLERKEQRDQESRAIEQFVDRLTEEAQVDTTEGVETTVASLDFAPEVRRVATEYLERARGE